ncbi:MAG TPA: tRNA uridine-5-carboxymethylaminomethyl(34) synthesis GTPase MnmE [Xanthobacteraceae bacterium]|nr:tRNA uridine-5-carboxymethylaminomethyl(34) synthesis GTPase MnmE [Xanthobacteraceae bacterium]
MTGQAQSDTIAPVSQSDTIAAVSSGTGRAGVAVLRVSGGHAEAALRALAGGVPVPRRASLRRLRHPHTGEVLDQGLVLWFPGPASATGEDMAEFHVHGGRAVVAACLTALLDVPGVRAAEPGEFTRRGFLNGRMDLTEVEGLADLLSAETEAQRRLALAHAFGHLGRRVEAWRSRLVRAMALIEAGIDFAEEDDVPAGTRAVARAELLALRGELDAALADRRGELVRDGLAIVIAGRPNAGKSSLLNALAARDIAIVSDEPGTTRDALEVTLDLAGLKVVLVDTAGLRRAAGAVEAEGIKRAQARISTAGLVLWVHDLSDPLPAADPAPERPAGAPLWLALNKADIAAAPARTPLWAEAAVPLSARSGAGIEVLLAALARWAGAQAADGGEHPALVRARHRAAAEQAALQLAALLAGWDALSDELIAEELRTAAAALGRITGRIGVEDLLDVVFREFCIGK